MSYTASFEPREDYPCAVMLRVEDRALCDWIEAVFSNPINESKPDIDILDMLILNGFSHDLFTRLLVLRMRMR